MAKNNNLTDFLTDVADAIREKKGTTEPINPQDFSSEIASIESGGGSISTASKNDVTFYDYEGTILYSYTKEEFLSLNEMPPLPTRVGLTCQGWNYTMEDAVAYVSKYGVLDVGATYITDDGKTRLYIRIVAKGRMNVPLYFSQTVANGVTIDWGDGSDVQTLSGTGNVNISHEYAEIGEYTIILNPESGCTLGLGYNSYSYCVMGSTGANGRVYCNMLQAVEIGEGVTSIGNYAFYQCSSLSSIVIPGDVASIGDYAFSYCYSLSSIVIPGDVASIGNYAFSYCYSLSSIVIPGDVASIGGNVFYNCSSLSSIVIPGDVASIGGNAFYNCGGMAYYDFKDSKSVPTLSKTSAFSNIPSDCKIVVPDSLYDSWIAATNWSTYKSNIVKASEFNV